MEACFHNTAFMPSVLAANQKGCVRVVVGVVVERGLLVCALFCYLSPATNPASASTPVTPGTSSLSTAKRGTRPLSSAAHKLNHPQLSKACQPCTFTATRTTAPSLRRRTQTCAAIHIPRRHPNRTRTAPLGHRNQPCCRRDTPPTLPHPPSFAGERPHLQRRAHTSLEPHYCALPHTSP